MATALAALAAVVAVPVAPAVGFPAATSPRAPGPFAGLAPAPPPVGWNHFDVSVAPGVASLAWPPSFAPIGGDRGTASAAVRDDTGAVHAYLNVTPRQGNERPRGFAAFRAHLLAGEHDQSVRLEGAAEGLAFRGGRGSCVLDDYVTRIGHHHFRELACFVVGQRGGAVVVAAATTVEWHRFEPQLRRAVATFALS